MEQKFDPIVRISLQDVKQQKPNIEIPAPFKIVGRLRWSQQELEDDIKRLEETQSQHSEYDEEALYQFLTPDQLNSLHTQQISRQRYCNLMRTYLQRYDDIEKCLYAFSKIPAIKQYYELIFQCFSTKKLTELLSNNQFFQLMITRFSECSYNFHFSRRLLSPALCQAQTSTQGYQRLAICKQFLPQSSKLKTIIENKFKSYALQQINSKGFIKNLIDKYHDPQQNSEDQQIFNQKESEKVEQDHFEPKNQDPQVSPIAVTCNSDRSQQSQVNLADICSIQDEQQYLIDLMGSSEQSKNKEKKNVQDMNITFLPFDDLQQFSGPQQILGFAEKTEKVNLIDALYKIIETLNRSNLRNQLKQGYKIFSLEMINELNYQFQNYSHLINPKRFVRVFYYFVKMNGAEFWDAVSQNSQTIQCILVKALSQFYEFRDQDYSNLEQRKLAKGQAMILRDQVFQTLDNLLDAKSSKKFVAKIVQVIVNFAVTSDQVQFMTKICWRNCKLGKDSVPKMLNQIIQKLETKQKQSNNFRLNIFKLLQKLVDVKYIFPGQSFQEITNLAFSKNKMVQNAIRSLIQTIKSNLQTAVASENEASIVYYTKYLKYFVIE